MPSDEDFRRLSQQVGELASSVAAAKRRIAELEDFATDHIGLDWGATNVDINSPHPNISANTIESGGGTIRQDANAMQVKASSQTTGIWFVDSLVSDPSTATPRSYIAGRILTSTDQGRVYVGANNSTEESYLLIVAHPTLSRFEMLVDLELAAKLTQIGTNTGMLSLSESNGGVLRIGDGRSAEPSAWQDGDFTYRSDTDKYIGRANGSTRNFAMEGSLILGTGTTLTIATGAVTVTDGYHLIDTESAAASDDLDTISGTVAGQTYVFRAANSARSVVFKDGTGNLKLEGDFTADNTEDTISMISDGTNLYELSRANNGA